MNADAGVLQAAIAVRELDEDTREELILAAGPKVHDLRPTLEQRRRNRELGLGYRFGKRPE